MSSFIKDIVKDPDVQKAMSVALVTTIVASARRLIFKA